MFRVALFAPLFVLAGLLAAAPAEAQRRGESRDVFEAMRTGKLLSIRDIEHRVVPTMRDAQYLGFDFDSGSGIYTLKFLRNGNVIWVEVDGHSGQVVGRSGN
ncbi:MAG: hypothetical protein K2W81_01765 [Sphingomonas sp.]|nr:hypothetical protein [Sphingomonas sp.]